VGGGLVDRGAWLIAEVQPPLPSRRTTPHGTHPPTQPHPPLHVTRVTGGFVASWTGVIRFHGPRPTPGPGRVWVANHTSMIDYIILSSYSAFAVIMQLHSGWVGFLQTKVLDSLGCLWFNRTEVKACVGWWGASTGWGGGWDGVQGDESRTSGAFTISAPTKIQLIVFSTQTTTKTGQGPASSGAAHEGPRARGRRHAAADFPRGNVSGGLVGLREGEGHWRSE